MHWKAFMSDLLSITKKKKTISLVILQIKAIILIPLTHKHQVGIGEIRQVCNFTPLWWEHTAFQAHITTSQQTCEAVVQGEAPMWGPDPSPEKSAQARTVNSRLGTQQSDHKTREEIAAWFSSSQPAQCAIPSSPPSSVLQEETKLHGTAFTSLSCVVLLTPKLPEILGSILSSSFSEQYARNCLLGVRLCQVHRTQAKHTAS